ncbi:MAG: FAD:protein FMN transferase [Candidatus Brocadiaceae bacterium]
MKYWFVESSETVGIADYTSYRGGKLTGVGYLLVRILFVVFILTPFSFRTLKAQTEPEPTDNFQLQTYLTEEQALALIFPECDDILTDEIILTADEKQNLEKILGRRLYEDSFKVSIGKRAGVIQRYAIITEEVGKFHPFSFIVGVNTDGKISNVAVLVYRESRGGEVARKRFLYQFPGKSFKNPIRINKDIINITGATMSAQYMCMGVRKVLAVINEYYLSGKRNVSDVKLVDSRAAIINKNMNEELKLLKQTRMIMGTFAEVSIYSNDERLAGKAIDEALNEMERMDRIMSNYKSDSELSQINKIAPKLSTPCGAELLDVVEQSIYYSEMSGGAFDITVSPIVNLWGFFSGKERVPSDKEIEKILPAVSYKNIVINKGNDSKKPGAVSFKNPQTQIDLGAIGKGYAVDKALGVIKKYGIDNGCINLGGNIYVLGVPPDKKGWKIGVQNPRKKDEIMGYMELKDEATATSGDYERFFEVRGKRYSHIIDPRTGRPVSSGTIATTIVAPTGTQVDALSTSVFVLGPEKGLNLIKKIPGAEAMIVYEKDGKLAIDMTQGFKEKFTKTGNW